MAKKKSKKGGKNKRSLAVVDAARSAPAVARSSGRVRHSGLKLRNYDAAATNNLTYSWTTVPMTADETLRRNQRSLRARSRQQVANNDYAKKFIGLVKTHIAGPDGVVLQARSQDPNGQPDKQANDAIESAWRLWGRRNNCDVQGLLSFAEQQRLMVATTAQDGEFLVRRYVGQSFGRFGYQLQHLDPELLDISYNEDLRNGNFIRMAIEFDSLGRRIAYHLIDNVGGEWYYQGRRYTRVPASEIFHCFLPELVGQKRGIPWMSTSLLRMNMLSGYEDAAMVNARVGASKMGFFYSPEGSIGGEEDKNTGELITEVEPGTFERLPENTRFEAFDPAYPNGEFGVFVDSSLRGIAAGLGVAHHTLSNNLSGVNYSSGRLGEIEMREVWKGLQGWFIDHLMRPLFEDWLWVQLATGSIRVNGNPLPANKYEKFVSVSFQGRRWQGVDPDKQGKADERNINNRLRSPQSIIREMGNEPEEVLDDFQRWDQMLSDRGLTMTINELEPVNAPESKDEEEANGDTAKD